ncbi:VapC toxin family PIN domain ribonuclease [Beijerinckiaceae bacterium RH AL1]|nr:PIN domain-containing protein [Beijerinckiaceae bacterium]VVB47937.1 VapC toxin family PIN domain ribonuclease [Beijerinckiaceae bacterium RH CH11]VVB48014.1 VapC toxin family PIN domain ribonuclease [Beijerinckiaceae bacterium RH AL8]VVC56139.1 VapC toxin family PIN domain ribonuclease [Beijerinckiaceae bacterium RH AL1]
MKVFFDTNILVYAAVQSDNRHAVARRLLAGGGSISVQVLNEFANVAHRKLNMRWADIRSALRAIRASLPALPITVAINELATALAEQHKFAFYDALIVASALEAKCTTLYSEDMNHGMTIRQSLTIINPFLPPGP